MYLAHADADAIATRIDGIERRTGVEVVVAIVGRTDPYPEARWKAFALAVALAALAVAAVDLLHASWAGPAPMLLAASAILAVGIVNALGAQFVPAYARLYVRRNRREAEARQYAESLFLARGLFAAQGRRAVLLLVALAERVVVVHADAGLDPVPAGEWERVVEPVTRGLSAGDRADAVQAGLTAIEALLDGHGFVGTGTTRRTLGNRPVEEKGP